MLLANDLVGAGQLIKQTLVEVLVVRGFRAVGISLSVTVLEFERGRRARRDEIIELPAPVQFSKEETAKCTFGDPDLSGHQRDIRTSAEQTHADFAPARNRAAYATHALPHIPHTCPPPSLARTLVL